MASYGYTFSAGDTVTPTRLNSARTVSDIVNADVSATAAIAGTKIAPAFGAQDITVSTANRSITNTGNFALSFGTNNTERVRVTNDGNVGIGTSSPSARIDSQSSAGIFDGLRIKNNATGDQAFGGSYTQFAMESQSASFQIIQVGGSGFLYAGAGSINIRQSSNAPMAFYANDIERMRIKPTGQVRFVPLSADPAGGETGDVYYNSSSNKLKVYNGTSWIDLH